MEHFQKAMCVIDTSSIINLDDIVLGRKDILFYIRRFFNVRVCSVIREELDRHQDLISSREVSYWRPFLNSVRYLPEVLSDDASVIGPFYTSAPTFAGTENAGEHGNARVALEMLLTRQIGHAVIVTDDEKANNAFLQLMRRAFPGVSIWSSADIILYLGALLLKENKTTFDEVRAAVRDVYAAGGRARPWEEITQAEKETIIRKQAVSVKSLRLVSRVVDHWRN